MYAGEFLVPDPDEIKGNKRKSQANVQVPTACFTHFYLSAYLWLRYGVKCPDDKKKIPSNLVIARYLFYDYSVSFGGSFVNDNSHPYFLKGKSVQVSAIR